MEPGGGGGAGGRGWAPLCPSGTELPGASGCSHPSQPPPELPGELLWIELSAPRVSPQAEPLAEMLRGLFASSGREAGEEPKLLLRSFRRRGSVLERFLHVLSPEMSLFNLTRWFYPGLKTSQSFPGTAEGASQALEKDQGSFWEVALGLMQVVRWVLDQEEPGQVALGQDLLRTAVPKPRYDGGRGLGRWGWPWSRG